MPDFDTIKAKAAEFAGQAVDKVSSTADNVTQGKYSDTIATVKEKAHVAVDKASQVDGETLAEIKTKAAGFADKAVDKVGQAADSVTQGKYSDKIAAAQDKAHDVLGATTSDNNEKSAPGN